MMTRIAALAAIFTLTTGVSVAAWSQQGQTNRSQIAQANVTDSIAVVGHLALPGAAVTNLRVLDDSTRYLIEVTDGKTHTLNIVDVADATHPRLAQQIRKSADLRNTRLQLAVGDAALFESSPAAAQPTPRTITIVNVANPKNPRTMRRFTDVTSVLPDRSRGLIYLTNPEGLWVLQTSSAADRRALERQFDEMLKSARSGG